MGGIQRPYAPSARMKPPVSSLARGQGLFFTWVTLSEHKWVTSRERRSLGADGFCLKQFFATDAAFRAVLLLFNLLSEFQRAAGLPGYREPATIRAQVLTCGAILGRAGRRRVIHLSESWGGLKTRIPLLDSLLNWQIPTSPKLEPAPVT